MSFFIHERPEWPNFLWDAGALLPVLAEVRSLQGRLLGRMAGIGFDLGQEAFLETLVLDVTKSAEIENEILDARQVRSSVARRLGLEAIGEVRDRRIEGVVEMLLDATQCHDQPLTAERLFGWHAALFPTGYSGVQPITTGGWRRGSMQVVSGAIGRETVHFQAPEAARVPEEMTRFLEWFDQATLPDPVLKALLGHLWFVTIHPFDDGNGRIGRALMDMLLARADGVAQRFYSMSSQLQLERQDYYAILEQTQRGGLEVTAWLCWGLSCLRRALLAAENTLGRVLAKGKFWQENAHLLLNERQRQLLNRLLDGFQGKLTTSKWAKIAKCSTDTALRDLQDLEEKGLLARVGPGGRGTHYQLLAPRI